MSTKMENFINEVLTNAMDKISEYIQKEYPYFKVYISLDGRITLWVNVNGNCRENISSDELTVYMDNLEKWLNSYKMQVRHIIHHPDNYFLCTICNRVLPMDKFEANVFAGYYCKDCVEDNSYLQKIISDSKKDGFYD